MSSSQGVGDPFLHVFIVPGTGKIVHGGPEEALQSVDVTGVLEDPAEVLKHGRQGEHLRP